MLFDIEFEKHALHHLEEITANLLMESVLVLLIVRVLQKRFNFHAWPQRVDVVFKLPELGYLV